MFCSNFNPRSPHGERPMLTSPSCGAKEFQPTLPARGATLLLLVFFNDRQISTHAPRTGSDEKKVTFLPLTEISTHAPRTGSDCPLSVRRPVPSNFNPRSPHGERPHVLHAQPTKTAVFQPTLPARGATSRIPSGTSSCTTFQPTLPARGATLSLCLCRSAAGYFNPRSPHGERPVYNARREAVN